MVSFFSPLRARLNTTLSNRTEIAEPVASAPSEDDIARSSFRTNEYREVQHTPAHVPTPGTYVCTIDSETGQPCYITNVDDRIPARLFVPGNELPFAEEVFRNSFRASFSIETPEGALGSGVAVATPDGRVAILTNRHVVEKEDGTISRNPQVTSLWTGKPYRGEVVALLPNGKYDMAMIILNTNEAIPTIPIGNSSEVAFGDDIFVVGNPLGLTGTLSSGNISNPRREEEDGDEFLQFTAPISPGNSGGGVFSKRTGQLIGLATFTIPGRDHRNGGQNLNFAYPADKAFKLLWLQYLAANRAVA